MTSQVFWPRVLRRAATVVAALLAVSAASGAAVSSSQATERPMAVGGRHAAAGAATANPLASAPMRVYLRGRHGDITAALYDLVNHRLYLYRPGITEQTASIVKVDILATLLHEEQATSTPLDADDESLATGMIEESDNDDATDLWNEVGGPSAIARFDSLAGLTDTAPNTEGYWGETMTTALDQIRLLEHVVLPNGLLDAASRAYEVGLMENVIPYDRWGVCAGPPAGVTVALKNGWVPIVGGNWQINSIGYVNGKGRSYLVSVLTNENPTEGYGIATIEGMSRVIWARLARPSKAK
ncbi:MAG: serine hydrolase [Acidimicrobiales bacterium]